MTSQTGQQVITIMLHNVCFPISQEVEAIRQLNLVS